MSESEPVATALNEAPVDAQEVMRKYDKESDYRILKGFRGKIIAVIAIVFSLFQVYTALFGVLDAMMQRSIHLAFGFCLIFSYQL